MAIYNITVNALAYGTPANSWTISGTGNLSGTNFSGGTDGDAGATATAFKNAVNAKIGLQDIVIATSVGAVITLKAKSTGVAYNAYALSKTDGSVANFTLSGPNFTGGVDGKPGFLFDSDLTHSGPGSRLWQIKNHGVPMMDLGRHETSGPTDLIGGSPDATVLNLFDLSGNKSSQLILEGGLHISSYGISLTSVSGGLSEAGTLGVFMALDPSYLWLGTGPLWSGTRFGITFPGGTNEVLQVGGQTTNLLMSKTGNTPAFTLGSLNMHWVAKHDYAGYSGGFFGMDSTGRFVGITGYDAFSFLSVIDGSDPARDAFRFNTATTIASANLLSVQNNGIEKLFLDKDGNLTITGNITTGGTPPPPPTFGYRQVSTDDYNVVTADYIIGVVTTTLQMDIIIPTAQSNTAGRILIIKDISGNAGTSGRHINIRTQGGVRNIDASFIAIIGAHYGVCRMFCDGTNWFTY